MFKQISVMKRHPALTMREFIERYESVHAKFGEQLFPEARKYIRRYVHPEPNHLTGEVRELDFDVVMEMWWDSEDAYKAAMARLVSSPLLPALRESGTALFASHAVPAFTVEEYESPLPA
ncbi:MAG: EthD domain-containing protein [Novosphingobium sp.]